MKNIFELLINAIDRGLKISAIDTNDKFKKICELLNNECEKTTAVLSQCDNDFSLLYQKQLEKVMYKEYALNGETIHRGYYCPSPIRDIVISNCNRGRLLKGSIKSSKVVREYGFNVHHNLILVIRRTEFTEYEMIDRYENIEIEIQFDYEWLPKMITKCIYNNNNQIISYTELPYNPINLELLEYNREEYTYDDQGLAEADQYKYLYNSALDNTILVDIVQQFEPDSLLNEIDFFALPLHNKYYFHHNDEGYLTEYAAVEYFGEKVVRSYLNEPWHKIKIKRKI